MKNKRKSSVSIIGGADGPTSIFIAGNNEAFSEDFQRLIQLLWSK